MMQCPACSAPLVSGEARCVACLALVNPPAQGASALAPRLVTPQNLEGFGAESELVSSLELPQVLESPFLAAPSASLSTDEAWRREVLERVRKRRQVRTHALPLFVEASAPAPQVESTSEGKAVPMDVLSSPEAPGSLEESDESLADPFDRISLSQTPLAPDTLASLRVPLADGESTASMFDLALRPAEPDAIGPARPRAHDLPSQSLVERPRPSLVSGIPANRSLVADLPLVEPTRVVSPPVDAPPRLPASTVNSKAATMNDRAQAALIDVGAWSAMNAAAFYFASRVARTSIVGLAPAWQGLALFAVVLAAAYILFFGGLSGATPGKIACGIQVKRYDGSSLGPLGSLGRGALGIVGVALAGLGVWQAFWDRDRRAFHDRVTDSRVTIVS